MSFLRPAARDLLRRWWGVGAGLALMGLGVTWGLTAFGFVRWLGWGLMPLGAVMTLAAAQKARFGGLYSGISADSHGGVGVVTVDEGRIAYFGPYDGGIVGLDDLTRLCLDHRPTPPHWQIDRPDQPPLRIPVDAAGAGALFDAFVALPGLSVETLLAARHGPKDSLQVIWQRPGRDDTSRLPRSFAEHPAR